MKKPSFLRLVLFIGLLLALAVTACTPVTPVTPVSDPTTDLPPTDAATSTPTLTPPPALGIDAASLRGVNVQVWHAFAGESYAIFNEQVALFNATNEWGITVGASGYGDYLTLFEAMQVAIQADVIPHMVVTLPEQALDWREDGLVLNLESHLHDPEYGLSSDALADFPPAFWVGPGVPAQRSARFLFYNQTWAHELGFTAPPATPDEFRQQACAANASFKANADLQDDGYGGWVVDADWQTAYSWLLAFDASLMDGESYTFRTDDILSAFEFLKSLYDENCAWLTTDASPYDAFALRKALFVTGDLADLPAAALVMTNSGSTDEWMPIPFPGLEEPLAVAYGPSSIVLRSSPEEQLAAWLFARWLLAPENQAQWVEATGLLPLRFSVLDMIGPYRSASPQWDAAAGTLSLMETIPQVASFRKVRYVLADGLNYLFQVNLPVDDIPSLLDNMQSMAEELGDR